MRADLNRHVAPIEALPMPSAMRAAMLHEELSQVHLDLLDALAALEQLTRELPSIEPCLRARWLLSRTTHRRRKILLQVIDEVSRGGCPDRSAALSQLQKDELDMCRHAAEHLHAWTREAIAADWEGYRAAAAGLCGRLRRQIAVDRALLYPMLRRPAQD